MNGQIEREYQDALNSLEFSDEEKERMMKNLMKREEQAPVKRRSLRPLRVGLIAAALCAAMVLTAGAVAVAVQQASINFFDSYEEAVDAQKGSGNTFNGVYGILDDVMDYGEGGPLDVDGWWNGVEYGGQTLVEEAAGTDQDGWTTRRTFQHEMDGQTFLTDKYKAERLSGLDGLWKGWDTSWLEEHYTTVLEHMMFEQVKRDGIAYRSLVIGEFRGQGDTVFNVQYSWQSDMLFGDQAHLRDNLDHTEVYTTSDGVNATIMTATTHSGKSVFWVAVLSGHSHFSMFGTQMELGELYTILDSLNLSNLLEYETVG